MKLSKPTGFMFVLSFLTLGVGVLGHAYPDLLAVFPPQVVANSYWITLGGYGVLTMGVIFKGL